MTELDLVSTISQTGFPIAVAVWLLWKSYTQDKEYLAVLQKLSTMMEQHIKQKDEALELLKDVQKK